MPVLAVLVLQGGLSLAAFSLPLWGVHQRLVDEKRRRLAELNGRVEKLQIKLKESVDRDN